MKHFWNPEELNNYWSISYDEQELLKTKSDISKIGFIIQLKHYKLYGIFPNGRTVAPIVLEYLSGQLGLDQKVLSDYDWKSRSCRRHKKEILVFLGIKRITDQDKKNFYQWLKTDVFLHGETTKIAYTSSIDWFRSNCIIAPADKELKREISSVYSRFENGLLKKFSGNLHPNTRKAILACLNVSEESNQMSFNKLRSDPGRIGLKTILVEIEKLKYINDCELPYDRLKSFHPKIIQRLYRRVSSEVTWEVKRHPGYIGETLLCVFLYKRREQIIDALVELLIQIIGKLTKRAEKKVVKSFIKDIRKVQGKNILLMRIAKAALENPEDMVKNVVYPIADKQKLSDIINEYKSSGKGYHDEVHKIIRASYSSHYRRMVPRILETMEFRSNNSGHRPILEALDLIKSNGNAKRKHFDLIGSVPIEDIIKPKWYDIIVEPDNDGTERINKIDYEIAVLEVLRDKLRCKEIWVAGADKYRNPDEDVPPDFHLNREFYYGQLGITENAKAFSEELKLKLHEALDSLNRTIPSNKHVKFRHTSKKNIILSPVERQSEPININKLKGQVQSMWPMTSLLDILKETDLKVNFSSCFKTQRTSERLDKNELRKRLLLTLYGLGTNTGLKRISSGNDRVTYKELLHIRKFYVHKQAMRNAIRETANAIFRVRNTDLWGEGTAACASDSKKFGSWDQNLMTEWHIRYGGRGVMIYWHVDKKSTCIYSQLKRCSSSEVANMIEGVLRHCTDMSIQKQYVDTHGQSEVAFAFCHLLGFDLMPRLKNIAGQKLYLPDVGMIDELQNLTPILTRPIKWGLIHQQYDEMVKYTSALKQGTADPESILKRFTRNNAAHPTYKALSELGKVIKTIFLCKYLEDERLRQEIQEGLNVVENWNSANSFIFFGKGGEVSSNRLEDQELSVLALHLVQISMVYINTLMIQQIVTSENWFGRLTKEDYRALTPLIYAHVNPYGRFELDMDQRLGLVA